MKRPWYLLALCASGCAFIGQLLPKQPLPGLTEKAVRVGQGAEVMASAVAMQEVLRSVRAELDDAGALAPDGGVQAGGEIPEEDLDYQRCYLNPATYAVWVEPNDAGTGWHVEVFPEAPCSKGSYGGGGEFEIDGESFHVLKGEIFE